MRVYLFKPAGNNSEERLHSIGKQLADAIIQSLDTIAPDQTIVFTVVHNNITITKATVTEVL